MRTFVAIFPPPEVREATSYRAREALQQLASNQREDRIRWVKPENVHLTLKFLGDVREEVLAGLCTVLDEVVAGHASFDVGLAGLGAFPSARRARILWAGVGAGSEELRSLAVDLDASLAPLGFEREKRSYTPHLTLGRIPGRPASFDLPPSGAEDLGFRVRRVDLVRSTLTPEGALYETVRAFEMS